MIERLTQVFIVAALLCTAASVFAQDGPIVDVAQPSVSEPLSVLATRPASQPAQPPATPEAKAINAFVGQALGGKVPIRLPQPTEIQDAGLAAQFPARKFYLLTFRMYPVAQEPAEPLAMRNIFALDKDNKVTHITDVAGLKALFVADLPARKTDPELKQAAAAWLRLSHELANDGMYRFSVSDDDTKIAAKDAGKIVTGLAKVTAGARGGGTITAQLTFDKDGKLTGVSEEHELNPGIRPICQGTKLLDPDPIVRGMAERDLLVMGMTCKFYLADQWRKAEPKLRVEIERVWRQIVSEAGMNPETNMLP